jgi:hypothetical protein
MSWYAGATRAADPAGRTDDLRTALVVEGGGMRGAHTGGMVRGLEELGLRDSFDEIFGTSSGAYVAAAFATGQGIGAATIYADDLSGTRFIDYRRPLAGRGSLMHFDYLIDTVLATAKPLDFAALAAVPHPRRARQAGHGDRPDAERAGRPGQPRPRQRAAQAAVAARRDRRRVREHNASAAPPGRRARLLAVRPLVSHRISGLTSDPDRLRHGADAGTAAIHAAFAAR